MSIVIKLSPDEEAELIDSAGQAGLAPGELAESFVRERLQLGNLNTAESVADKLRKWQQEDGSVLEPDESISDLFARWAMEDETMTDQERGAADILWNDFVSGINRSRAETGMRLI